MRFIRAEAESDKKAEGSVFFQRRSEANIAVAAVMEACHAG
ncbi:MAG: hypothetical protein O2985_09990 [Proteobacteria bacterium]|nr:hypothetical protein [Pseudomonadota bacterium]